MHNIDPLLGSAIICTKKSSRSVSVVSEITKQDQVCIAAQTPKTRHSHKYSLVPKNLTISPIVLDCSQDSLQVSQSSSNKPSNHGKSPGISQLSSGSSPGPMCAPNVSKSPLLPSPASSSQSSLNTTPLSVSIWYPQAHSSPDASSPGHTPGSNNSGSSFICDTCSKSFTSRSNLNKHRRVIHAGEEYFCPYCERSFKNRYYIKDHINLCFTAKKNSASSQVFVLDDSISNAEIEVEKPISEEEAKDISKDSPNVNKSQEPKVLQFNML